MQHETATVKKVIKKYTVKDGIEKESISYNVKLKADSEFDDGDNVAVVLLDDFNNVADVNVDEIHDLKNAVADKDETIAANNKSIDKLNAELKSKMNLINDVTAKLKASEKTIDDLESDISEKDNIIAELKSDIKVSDATISDLKNNVTDKDAELVAIKKVTADNDKTIAELSGKNDELHKRLNDLSDLLTGKDETIDELDADIVDYKIKIAEYNAIDIDKLKEKSDELDDVKNELVTAIKSISLLQNQIMELQQLVNYKDKEIDAVKNQNVIYKLIGKDATANITAPTLSLIDSSGNLIKNDKSDIDVDATDVADDHVENDDDDDSGDDTLTII